jgi:acetyl esterase/lipase
MPSAPAESPRPAVVQVHGGAWIIGSRREQGIPLLTHMAANGWVGFNVDYRLSPRATFPDHIVDVKRAIAWVRENADEYGVDPSFVAITGGSAGGHLSALAALTAEDAELQPGFEEADTSVAAAVPFYGVYDLLNEGGEALPMLDRFIWPLVFKARPRDDPDRFRAASPMHRVHPGAPPMFVVHGEHDSLIAAAEARRFVERLREQSEETVLYAEMKGGQHAFDIVPSWRTVPVVEAILGFLATIHGRHAGGEGSERELRAALSD